MTLTSAWERYVRNTYTADTTITEEDWRKFRAGYMAGLEDGADAILHAAREQQHNADRTPAPGSSAWSLAARTPGTQPWQTAGVRP